MLAILACHVHACMQTHAPCINSLAHCRPFFAESPFLFCILQALVAHAHRLLPDFSPQNLSNTAWALATLKDCDIVRSLHKVWGEAAPFGIGQRGTVSSDLLCIPFLPSSAAYVRDGNSSRVKRLPKLAVVGVGLRVIHLIWLSLSHWVSCTPSLSSCILG